MRVIPAMRPRCAGVHILPLNHAQNLLKTYHSEFPKGLLAEHAARELVAGQRVHTHDLVVSLRNFVRQALDLAPIPSDLSIPIQGPTRVQASGGKGKDGGAEKAGGGGGGNGGGGGMQGGGDMAMTGSHTADNQDSITPSGH
ncbi:hypothetical protein SRCM100623_02108 [Acetobacter pasteurianus]|uniref:Uncharacterized protein n=1 Tax=Acetobacter pasteurianus TaxID=438 RepID=A0A1A0D8P9_ACEPA|nr:hypothetical protein SRCM100623_02108 [Acetobacter pasteurianus]